MTEVASIVGTIVTMLNMLTPLGLAGGLTFIIYQIVSKKGSVKMLSDNHLSGLPEMLDTLKSIDTGTQSQARILETIRVDISETAKGVEYLKGRADRRSEIRE